MRPRIRKEEFTPKSHTFILDRIFRHAVKIEIRGPSYRQHLGREFQKKYEKHQEIYLTTAYLPNHISNRQFIVDFEKVVDFIMEMNIPLYKSYLVFESKRNSIEVIPVCIYCYMSKLKL